MTPEKLKKLQYYYTFFNVFSVIVIVQNISIFFFPFLVRGLLQGGNKLLSKINAIDFFAIILGFGAMLSVLSTLGSSTFSNSIVVLPNYLYWIFLLILLPAYAKKLDYREIFKAVFWGIIISCIYFYTLNNVLSSLIIFKDFQQNTFSFILICFSPIAVYYAQERYGKVRAILIAIAIVAAGAFSGSRSGSIITILTCFLTLYSNKINIVRVIGGAIIVFLIVPFLLQTSAVKSLIFGVNERTYELIYAGQEGLLKDESYLIRVAQVEKGIGLFKEHPLTGIGLNNFSKHTYNIRGDFEGSELVMNIENLDQLSAHNSYIGLLAEGGIFVFGSFIAILLVLFGYLIVRFKKIPDFQKPFFWGLLGMCIHLYFIMAIVNIFAWLLIALAASSLKYNSKK